MDSIYIQDTRVFPWDSINSRLLEKFGCTEHHKKICFMKSVLEIKHNLFLVSVQASIAYSKVTPEL